ncbi:MAG: transposase [Deltaproteobacteria bacterium]|nr:transposase [Deltaproteobacteria bacterium]
MINCLSEIFIRRDIPEYNQVRPHSSLGYRPPAPETMEPMRVINW